MFLYNNKVYIECDNKKWQREFRKGAKDFYTNLYLENYNLFWFVSTDCNKYNNYVVDAFNHDNNMRNAGYVVNRNKNTGIASVYKNNKLEYNIDIYGNKIQNFNNRVD